MTTVTGTTAGGRAGGSPFLVPHYRCGHGRGMWGFGAARTAVSECLVTLMVGAAIQHEQSWPCLGTSERPLADEPVFSSSEFCPNLSVERPEWAKAG